MGPMSNARGPEASNAHAGWKGGRTKVHSGRGIGLPDDLKTISYQNRLTHQRRRRMRIKHNFKIRDARLGRPLKIQSSLVREDLQRVMWQTNDDCRVQILI